MQTFKRLILHLCGLGWNVAVAWPMVLLVWWLWGTGLRWEHGRLKCALKPDSFPISTSKTATGFWKWWTIWPRGFYLQNRYDAMTGMESPWPWAGTSVGDAQFFGPGQLAPVGKQPTVSMVHEDHHTLQARAAAVSATGWAIIQVVVLLALGHPSVALWMGLGMWILGGNLSISTGGWIAAWLDSHPEGFYRGSAHEIGAYAVGDLWHRRMND